ncbi:aminopeptidase P family protein [Bacteroidota bacterium]
MPTIKERIAALREQMCLNNLDAYIIPSTDPHAGEYIPEHWQSRKWISGFTGSAGTVVVTNDMAGLWTDSRYFIQAEKELENSGIQLIKMKIPHFPCYMDWLGEHISEGSCVGLDGNIFSITDFDRLKNILSKKKISIDSSNDLINNIWTNRPTIPKSQIFIHDIKYAGYSTSEKIEHVRQKMSETGVNFHLITTLDDIAWLFNIRGNDVEFNPVAVSYALISMEKAVLFIFDEKVDDKTRTKLTKEGVQIEDYYTITDHLSKMQPENRILISPGKTNICLYDSIPKHCSISKDLAITTRLKAIKNKTEIKHLKNLLVKDGIALEKFLFWLEKNLGLIKITELSAAEKLTEFRRQQENYIAHSFYPISGYKGNGAMAHYHVLPETDKVFEKNGLYLIDSGGQYLDGTTDTTRTVSLGYPTSEEKTDFTLALVGMIRLSMIKFPEGTFGHQLDVFARKAMWDRGMNYGHGTGHGVGFFLNVHEGPQGIGPRPGDPNTTLENGMVITNEPALYKPGKHGVRTENMLIVVNDIKTEFGQFLKFDTITLCHIDTGLIDMNIINDEEKEWINNYHKLVFEKLSPHLDKNEKNWLRDKTQKI